MSPTLASPSLALRHAIGGVGLLAVLGTAACSSDDTTPDSSSGTPASNTPTETPTSPEPSDTPTAEQPTTTPTETSPSAAAPTHSDPAARAGQGALAAVPGAVISIDPERGQVWSVLVRTADGAGTEVYVKASDGTVQRQRSERLPAVARSAAPTFTAEQAIDVALGALPNGQVRELDLDRARGKVVWEVLVRSGRLTEFYIDAETGAILKQEIDD